MKWSALWKVLKVVAENAPMIIQVIQQVAAKDAAEKKR